MRTVALKAKIKRHVEAVRHLKSIKSKVKASSWSGRIEEMALLAFDREAERKDGRAMHLAYGYIRGRAYADMEAKTSEAPTKSLVKSIAGLATTTESRIEAWVSGATAFQKTNTTRQIRAGLV